MWISALATAGVASYFASTLLPVRGLHDWIVPGAVFKSSTNVISLSFDDGPHPERTPVVLDMLGEADAKANFFVLGERAVLHPDLVRRIVSEGHELGNHSWSHAWMPRLSNRQIKSELERCQTTLTDITGRQPTLVRPPYGSRDFRFYRIAKGLGLTSVLWSLDSQDWAGVSQKRVRDRIVRARGGDIVLLHDGNPGAQGLLSALADYLGQQSTDTLFAPVRSHGYAAGSVASR